MQVEAGEQSFRPSKISLEGLKLNKKINKRTFCETLKHYKPF